MAAPVAGFYYDRYRVLQSGKPFAGVDGNIRDVEISTDGGVTFVDGMSQDHFSNGVLRGNTQTRLRITEYLQYNVEPADWESLDYELTPFSLQLCLPNSQYAGQSNGNDVFNGGIILNVPRIYWDADAINTSYGQATTRVNSFLVVGRKKYLHL
jgi:hypothetical protein